MHRRISFQLAFLWLASSGVLACSDDGGAVDSTTLDGSSTDSPTTGSSSDATSLGTSSTSSADGSSSSAAETTASESSSGTETDGPPEVELGAVCPIDERVGEVAIWLAGGEASLAGRLWDAPDPWIGPAELTTDTCAFHHFATDTCGQCEDDEVCSFAGECVPVRRADTDAELDVTANGATMTIEADDITGDLYGIVGDGDADISLTLRFGGETIEVPAIAFAHEIPDLALVAQGDSCTPLGLDATWTPSTDGARVRTVIPINHHAGGPTFTVCDAPGGSFHADAEMLQPLAVITCLEYQGVDVANTAALHTPLGCVDVRLGVQPVVDLQWQ